MVSGDVSLKRPRKGDLAGHWILDPETCFLNHGSFGATPLSVLEEQSRLRNLIESDPVRFFERNYIPLMKAAIGGLSEFMNANPEGLVFVKNTTEAVSYTHLTLPTKA